MFKTMSTIYLIKFFLIFEGLFVDHMELSPFRSSFLKTRFLLFTRPLSRLVIVNIHTLFIGCTCINMYGKYMYI